MKTRADLEDEIEGWRELVNIYARLNHSKALELFKLADRSFEECEDPMCIAAREALGKGRKETV